MYRYLTTFKNALQKNMTCTFEVKLIRLSGINSVGHERASSMKSIMNRHTQKREKDFSDKSLVLGAVP